ncbi:hypothetical protein [Actinomadura sp. 21ATH]|uniref:hypothetical protein n=1 Tax=Actinomadura sp. 21ATH TaxID=1735444 RepID=UPI0035C1644E
MPTSHRARQPVRPGTDHTVQVSGMSRLFPASIAAAAFIVFALSAAVASPILALIMALATAAVGGLGGAWFFRTGRSPRSPEDRTSS